MASPALAVSRSLADRLASIAASLKDCQDIRDIRWQWGRIVRSLEFCEDRVILTRSRGGSVAPTVGAALDRLESVVSDHPAFDEPGGAGLRDELLRLADWAGR